MNKYDYDDYGHSLTRPSGRMEPLGRMEPPGRRPKKRSYGFLKFLAVICLLAIVVPFSYGVGYSVGIQEGRIETAVVEQTEVEETVAIAEVAEATVEVEAEIAEADLRQAQVGIEDLELLSSASTIATSNNVRTIQQVADAVVNINTERDANWFDRTYAAPGAGSGIIIHEDDEKIYIVTNYHVIRNTSQVSISFDHTNRATASIVASDPNSDIAVISVLKTELARIGITTYLVAEFGDSDALEIGEEVIAIGNAAGAGRSATKGIVSALNRSISVDRNFQFPDMIQTDAAINQGNSGGALVNMAGQVIGVNTAKAVDNENMGFAIPSNMVQVIAEELINREPGAITAAPVRLGITGFTVTDAFMQDYGLPPGAVVDSILEGSNAYRAQLQRGDVITRINDVDTNSMEDVAEVLTNLSVGDTIQIVVFRYSLGTHTTLQVTLN